MWQKRYFCARGGFLLYFADQAAVQNNTAKGCINLTKITSMKTDGRILCLYLNKQTFYLKHENSHDATDWERDLMNRIGVLNALKGLKRVHVTIPGGKGEIGMTLAKHSNFNALVVMKLHHEKDSAKAPMRGEAAGVHEDDIVVCINKQRVHSEEMAQRILARDNQTVSITLWRGQLASCDA